jgi:hypothetical protein
MFPKVKLNGKWISVKDLLADILTKPLVASKFIPLHEKPLGW